MASTRSIISPGIFAENASTVIPPTPIAGVSYRDTVSGTDDIVNGWRYGTRVESQDWNQIVFLMTSMLSLIDKKGVIGWSNLVDYTESALTFGSDGNLYVWIQASGPGNGGAKDPISSPTFWKPLADNAQSNLIANNGWRREPDGWMEQWGFLTTGIEPRTVVFPQAFSNAFGVHIQCASNIVPPTTAVSYNVDLTNTGFTINRNESVQVEPFYWRAYGLRSTPI